MAVLGRQDPTWGEAVHAVIIPAGEAVPAGEIIAWCRDRLAHFKCPKSVEFTDALPRTTTGKVLKRELRAHLASASQRAAALPGQCLPPRTHPEGEERGTSERATKEGSASK